MNVLFLTLVKIQSLEDGGIFPDLLRKFRDEGHQVNIVSPIERRDNLDTHLIDEFGAKILRVKTLNIQKTNFLEKGIGSLAIEYQYLKAVKSYFVNHNFDLVLYSTPPITFAKVVQYIKKRDNAYSYLLLKDIFPQNAVDLAMIRKGSLIHEIFLRKERKLYQVSDMIGCMSQANVNYVLKHNNGLPPSKVEINPNSIEPTKRKTITFEQKQRIKTKYGLPLDKKIFVYGGNLGKPQGLDFLLKTIGNNINEQAYFLVVGSGTEYNIVKSYFDYNRPVNAKLLKGLPKIDYDELLSVCDVGLIFLHRNFTIPNFPGRLLAYLEMEMPVIAATDVNTDIGKILVNNCCGYWLESGDDDAMRDAIAGIISNECEFEQMKKNAWVLLQKDYTVSRSYRLIKNKLDCV